MAKSAWGTSVYTRRRPGRSGLDAGSEEQKQKRYNVPRYLSGPIKTKKRRRVPKEELLRRYVQRTMNAGCVPDGLGVRQRWSNTFAGQYVLREPEKLADLFKDLQESAGGNDARARAELVRGIIQLPEISHTGAPKLAVGDRLLYLFSTDKETKDSDSDPEESDESVPSTWPCTVTDVDHIKKTFTISGDYEGEETKETRPLTWYGAFELVPA